MIKTTFTICAAILMFPFGTAVAQQSTVPTAPKTQLELATSLDARVSSATRNVSAADLKKTIEKLVSFGTRNTISPSAPGQAQSGQGIGAAREWIKSEFEHYSQACGGCLEVKEDRFTEGPVPRIPQATEIVNVYAILRGSDPEQAKRIYLITGHYDSRATDVLDVKTPAPGANDDGSGTAAVLESARVLSKQKFPATIVFLAVAGEEQGLNGSKHFAKMAKDQGWNIEAVLNDDTVGGDKSAGQRPDLLRVFAEGIPLSDLQGTGDIKALRMLRALGETSDTASRELARYIEETSLTLHTAPSLKAMMIYRPDRFLRGGDHTSFNEQGYAAVRLTEWRENYDRQHQNPRTENGKEYGDLPKFMDFDYLARVTQLNVAVLGSLAAAPSKPSNFRILTKDLTNESTLTWEASRDAAGYEVVWRDTTAPEWQHKQLLPATATRTTLDVSKDNVIFGLRAVSKTGAKSLTVLPVPER